MELKIKELETKLITMKKWCACVENSEDYIANLNNIKLIEEELKSLKNNS